MKLSRWILATFLLVAGLGCGAAAQDSPPEVEVVAPELQDLHWGDQTLTFSLRNNTDYLKFLVTRQVLTIEGTYDNVQRVLKKNYMLWPQEQSEIDMTVSITGFFGSGTVFVEVYDVVDTLDELYSGYDIYQRNFEFKFGVPDGLLDYAQADLEVPPRVNRGMDFNFDFSRLLVKMIEEGKSVSEIANLVECSETYVERTIDSMVNREYFKQSNDGPQVAMPYITAEHAQRASVKIDSLAARFAEAIEKNLGPYKLFLDSLQTAGAVSKDTNDFLDPGTIIYRRYSMIVPLLLWYDLGQEFISKPEMLFIFGESDPCHAWIPHYMYMVEQGGQYNGDQYFFMTLRARQAPKIIYADHVPKINCPDQYWMQGSPLYESAHWKYVREDLPENFLIDTARVHLALRHLRAGLEGPLNEARADARARGAEAGADRNPNGYRYWYWNLLATRTTQLLLDRGRIHRPGNGNLRFEVYR